MEELFYLNNLHLNVMVNCEMQLQKNKLRMNISTLHLGLCIQRLVPLRQSNPLESLTMSSLVSLPEGKILMRLGSCESNHMVNCFSVNLAIVIKA